ncbi:MAG: type IX secretion system membrane protein PorP/SprF [Flavobacteriales bacterium]|uniref:PorP/SprF family type IX secretion system membrane protein n=1 Tax=Sanyastnella coralliicola TaxID=3069118 RepID=UPI0027B90751|nr:type IX secretion system membrane protein PorP/SprF [Longitalea sp. SCSIO 12813]MCH2200015.1 type IX secretion system membrane protein PorP/SprF [Flavobacteriales bacterium]
MRRLIIAISFLVGLSASALAQDTQFTQFYAAPTYMNPAFAGTTVQSRLSANYRNQWPAIPGAWVAYNASYDHYVPEFSSGFGLIATREQAGTGALRSTTVGLQYAYEIQLNRELYIRPALQFSYSNRNISFSNLTFSDQLIRDNAATTLEDVPEPINFFDMGTGVLLYSPKYWIGAAIHHLNQPNESIYPDKTSLIPRRLSLHGGYRMKVGKGGLYRKQGNAMLFAFNYLQQAEFSQLDLGAYLELEPIVIGLWYRGLPGIKSNNYGYINHDAIAVMLGYGTHQFRFGYSYDITLSQLSLGMTAGSHELSMVYEWANKRNGRLGKKRIIPCAKF